MMNSLTAPNPKHLDQRYLVVGLGMSGFSAAKYLLGHGYTCVVQDSRQQPPYLTALLDQFPSCQVRLEGLTENLLNAFDCLVVSPGLSLQTEVMKKVAQSGKRIIGDIELFAEAVKGPVLAITGSNGKSTVTTLLGEMIAADGKKVAVGGNIGVPALDLLADDVALYVLELSSFQLDTTRNLKLEVATVLNVSEDHMDRYQDFSEYQRSKVSIYRNARYCVSNQDDPATFNDTSDIRFSLTDSNAAYTVLQDEQNWLSVEGEKWIACSELKLKGRHNWANCLAAMAMARLAGVSKAAILQVLRSFAGLEHRSQWVAEIDGVSWINDSKATNTGAARAAIEGIDEPIILIAGGQAKGADVKVLCESLSRHVKTVLVFGQDAAILQQSWQDCVALERVQNMDEAVQRARELAVAGDLVLLSPACASLDMYSSFAARGDHFCRLVGALS